MTAGRRFLKPGGIIALHNAAPDNHRAGHDGSRCVAEEEVGPTRYTEVRLVDSTIFARKSRTKELSSTELPAPECPEFADRAWAEAIGPALRTETAPSPAELRRLVALCLHEQSISKEWSEELAALLKANNFGPAHLIEHLNQMYLASIGVNAQPDLVNQSLKTRTTELKNFETRATVVVPVAESHGWLGEMIAIYRSIGINVLFAVHEATSPKVRTVLANENARHIVIGELKQSRHLLPGEVFKNVDADWLLFLNEDELPTAALLEFTDRAIELSEESSWGFPRAHVRYDPSRRELQHSQFCLHFAPSQGDCSDAQWRLIPRSVIGLGHGADRSQLASMTRRLAPPETLLLCFKWVVRTFAERLQQLQDEEAEDPLIWPRFRSLHECIPESWHIFTPI